MFWITERCTLYIQVIRHFSIELSEHIVTAVSLFMYVPVTVAKILPNVENYSVISTSAMAFIFNDQFMFKCPQPSGWQLMNRTQTNRKRIRNNLILIKKSPYDGKTIRRVVLFFVLSFFKVTATEFYFHFNEFVGYNMKSHSVICTLHCYSGIKIIICFWYT